MLDEELWTLFDYEGSYAILCEVVRACACINCSEPNF